jgi:hypothetical protein
MAASKIDFSFFALPSAGEAKKDLTALANNQLSFAAAVWNPKALPKNEDRVTFVWNGSLKTATEAKDDRVIQCSDNNSEQGARLVRVNVTFTDLPVIPVFLCYSLWDNINDGGSPRPGLLKGFTLTRRGTPRFAGQRAIFLSVTQVVGLTLAHELSHWFGFSHGDYDGSASNIGKMGGGGPSIDDVQHHAMLRWATQADFRKKFLTP